MVLFSRLPAPDWSAGENPAKEALCRKFPLPDDHDVSKDYWFHKMDEAVEVCNGTAYDGAPICPFRDECTHIALTNNEQSGVFGGLWPRQRKWIRRESGIKKADWEFPSEWRHTVPPIEFFDDDEEEDAEEG